MLQNARVILLPFLSYEGKTNRRMGDGGGEVKLHSTHTRVKTIEHA